MLDPRAQLLRFELLGSADQARATELANQVVDQVNRTLNAADVSMATSLLARALIARGIMSVAAEWWSDVTNAPSPLTYAAIADLVAELPPEWEAESFIDPTILGGKAQ